MDEPATRLNDKDRSTERSFFVCALPAYFLLLDSS